MGRMNRSGIRDGYRSNRDGSHFGRARRGILRTVIAKPATKHEAEGGGDQIHGSSFLRQLDTAEDVPGVVSSDEDLETFVGIKRVVSKTV